MSSVTPPKVFRALAAGLATTIAALIAAPLSTSAATPLNIELLTPHPENASGNALQWYVNTYRQRVGIPPVTLNSRLNQAAYAHAREMATRRFMTHTGASGTSAGTRISRTGYRWRTWGENVAAGQTTINQVMTAWYKSYGHRAVMLDRRFKNVGVGRALASDGTWYWCLIFASPG